jgi:hypothetical protein
MAVAAAASKLEAGARAELAEENRQKTGTSGSQPGNLLDLSV